MAHWRLGEREKAIDVLSRWERALARYERTWTPNLYPPPSMLRRGSVEAAKLLGIDEAEPTPSSIESRSTAPH